MMNTCFFLLIGCIAPILASNSPELEGSDRKRATAEKLEGSDRKTSETNKTDEVRGDKNSQPQTSELKPTPPTIDDEKILRPYSLKLDRAKGEITGLTIDGKLRTFTVKNRGNVVKEFEITNKPEFLSSSEERHFLGIKISGRFIYIGLSKLENLFYECFHESKISEIKKGLAKILHRDKKQKDIPLLFTYYDQNDETQQIDGSVLSFSINTESNELNILDGELNFVEGLKKLIEQVDDYNVKAHITNWASIYMNILSERLDWKSQGNAGKLQLTDSLQEDLYNIFRAYRSPNQHKSLQDYFVIRESLYNGVVFGQSYDPKNRNIVECGSPSFSQMSKKEQRDFIKMWGINIAASIIAVGGISAGVIISAGTFSLGFGLITGSTGLANILSSRAGVYRKPSRRGDKVIAPDERRPIEQEFKI